MLKLTSNPVFKPLLPCLLACLLAAGCESNYRLVLNDNVLYTPGGTPVPSLLADAALQGCLNQLLSSRGTDDPDTITLLACPAAGVQSLAGINALPNLEQLELSDNSISDLSPLLNLKDLRVLSIRNNRLTNINALLSLPILRFVSLEGNNEISCRQLNQLEEKVGNTLNRPLGCRS